MAIKFATSERDASYIEKIVDRIFNDHLQGKRSRTDWIMDINACHLNGTRLDLPKLLDADLFDFTHDVIGIYRNISRKTGKIMNCFLPRCAKRCGD